jgi:cell division FtsZ-interacting protein ZapD
LVLYEYPFNESIRTMLRLEHLFDRLGQLIARATARRPPLRARHDLRGAWTSPRAPT